ncbi:MAG: division/cell wall cluster transcriptional repressor MraZ [Hyphomonadaceae bacterium]
MFFTGRYRNGVDAKGRVSVPAALRASLKGADGVYLSPAQHLRCLEGAGPDFLERRAETLDGLDPLDPRRAALERLYFGEALWLGFDTAGRITLPEALRAEFALQDEAVFVGVRDRFELWAPNRESEWAREARDIAAGMTSLSALKEGAR